jgi:hypothetical protein
MPRSLASMMNSTSNIDQSKPSSSWSNQPTETTKAPPPPPQQQQQNFNNKNDNIQSSSISLSSSQQSNRSPTRSPFATDQTAAYQGSFDDMVNILFLSKKYFSLIFYLIF